ncbi:MAG: protein kinase domain-containing protein [Blastocatellia bacterium]
MKYCPECKQEYSDSQRFCLSDGQLLSLPDPYHLVGRTLLDKYRIDALVGIGGMGAVYGAHHLMINRRVAFKILQPNLTIGAKRLVALFQREAELAGQLSHENIVDIKDAGSTPDGIAYIVMEWLEGHTLDDELEAERQLSFVRAAEITRQIAAALDHAHSRHIIHRDLKPSNIMLVTRPDGGEVVKVVDFGIAKVASETTASPVSRLMGTPHYASPEQFRIGSPIDGRADVYSLGVMLYQMIAGELPFNAQTAQELIKMQSAELPPPIRQYRAETPAAVEQLINRMLEKDPRRRPSTASEAVAIFERALNEQDLLHTASLYSSPATIIEPTATNEYDKAPDTIKGRATNTHPQRVTAIGERSDLATGAEPTPVKRVKGKPEPVKNQGGSQSPSWMSLMRHIAAWALVIALIAGGAALYRHMTRPERVELMEYYVEITSVECQTLMRGTGDESLKASQAFRFHFTPREPGYLYIITPNEKNVPTTFLTAQPNPDTGVKSNFIEAGADFIFPAGQDNCIGITAKETMMAFTVIFSPDQLTSPSYLTALAMRPLTGTEQKELADWREQFASSEPKIAPDPSQQLSRVTVLRKPNANAGPVVFDLLIKRQ